jgi:hypothetical protein
MAADRLQKPTSAMPRTAQTRRRPSLGRNAASSVFGLLAGATALLALFLAVFAPAGFNSVEAIPYMLPEGFSWDDIVKNLGCVEIWTKQRRVLGRNRAWTCSRLAKKVELVRKLNHAMQFIGFGPPLG